ncbi:uncharacterized protein LOC115918597 [Strongylocentrotus purpuratus]|uniref:Uncharacterized protein n=1 Tax=Strongylocentrotus purpuratus TaxID=7668 RepID=A0A7M7NTD0_STRPU|nr:uncharacterized protein LOC115918597 [Strongylocentrotus purpuratus]|eukprot:XP_800182.1 PREDICTED: uncharacterized protein LOC582499 [Strongylocentrotus purpuratus]
MARVAFFVVFVIVCAVSVASSPTEREISEKQIKEKGRMLLANFRQKARTLLTMKVAEWKTADQIETNVDILERFQHVEKEAEYEIKQHIVDAINGNEPVVDPDIPPHSEEIATLFGEALFATTYAEQSTKEDSMIQILKDILENKLH